MKVAAVHPGAIQTELVRHATPEVIRAMAPAAAVMTMKSVPQGAATSVWSGVVAAAAKGGG